MLVERRSLDREQQVPEVLAHAQDGRRLGLAEKPLLGGGLDGEDLLRVPPAGRGERDQDLAPVPEIDVAADPALTFEPGHPVGDRARGDLGEAQQGPGAPGGITELQEAADVLTDTLLSHLAYEERELIDPLARYGFYGYSDDG
jgi:hypothetical protein